MSAQYPVIATAFVNNQPVPRNARMFAAYFTPDRDYIGAVNTNPNPKAPAALFSYGPHFPIVIEASERFTSGYWLNESGYAVTETDRYESGYYKGIGPMPRSPKFSPTTKKQVHAVERALINAGFHATEDTKTVTTENTDGDPTTYTFRFWAKG